MLEAHCAELDSAYWVPAKSCFPGMLPHKQEPKFYSILFISYQHVQFAVLVGPLKSTGTEGGSTAHSSTTLHLGNTHRGRGGGSPMDVVTSNSKH